MEKIPSAFAGPAAFPGRAVFEMPPPRTRLPPLRYDPVTIGDLADEGLKMTIHCRACGHWAEADPATLALSRHHALPALEGAFRCTLCGSRKSCAMPLYPRRLPGS